MTETITVGDVHLTTYPDPILDTKVPDLDVDLETAREIGKKMLAIMKHHQGVGLAGPQANVPGRIIVINYSGKPQHDMICINPYIVELSDETDTMEEGCLSLPGIRGDVERSSRAVVEFTDTSGTTKRMETKGLLARIFQHEIDHLNGIQILNHFGSEDTARIEPLLKNMRDDYERRGGGAA